MTAHHPHWAPETERAFKEVLYRFMGDVHATKAALYLKSPDDEWLLTSQYGFGRRDRLAELLADDHPLVRMVRAFGNDSRFYNDSSEVGEIASYLADAGTTRLMLVPIGGQAGLTGFVDVRDKGGQRPFIAEDLDVSRAIAMGLSRVIEEAATAGSEERLPIEEIAEPAPRGPEIAVEPGGEPRALFDEPGFDELNTAAYDALVDPRILAIALTIVNHRSGAMLVYQRAETPAIDTGPFITHQSEALQRASVGVPPPEKWKTELRRVPGAARAARNPAIATAVLLDIPDSGLAASVVADSEPAVARQILERIGDRATEARERFRLRIARRGLARRLLQPGDRRFPELVAHSLGVSRLCWSISRVLELEEAATENAALAGLLHDVGMRELDYDRLYMHPTPGPEDRRTYRMHVEVGDRIVRVAGFEEIADAVRHHHERWDGNGYPDRLATDTIPLLARIVHVAEVFDLFTAANSYRPAVSQDRALTILERAAGHQFDPVVVKAMVKVIG